MKKHIWLVLILVVGAGLRFYHNTDISLWHDEAFSALLVRYSWPEMMYRIGLDVHPPMYYIFLRFWHYIFGDSLLALRGMTIFFGVGTIVAAWGFVKQAFKNEKLALWTALLVAVNPFQVQYATEARMYTMGAFFAVLAAYFITRALHAQHDLYSDQKLNMPHLPKDISLKKVMYWNYLGFVLSIIILIYTHYYLFFTAAALCFYALVYHLFHYRAKITRYGLLALSYVAIVAAYVPWLKTFLFQYGQVGAGYWIPPMDRWSIPTTIYQLTLGFGFDISKPKTQYLVGAVFVVMLVILFRFLRKTQMFEKWLVLLAIIAPFAGSVLFLVLAKLKGSNSSVYLVRYFLYTSAFFSVVIAVWLGQLKWKKFAFVCLLVYSLINLFAFSSYWKDVDIQNRPGMAAASKYLQANVEPQHKLFVGTSFEFFNFKYYWYGENSIPDTTPGVVATTAVRPLLFTGGTKHAKEISHFAGSAILTDGDLVPNFSEGTKRGDTVWLLWTNAFGSNKPEVPKNWEQKDEKGYADVRPYLGTWVIVTQYLVR